MDVKPVTTASKICMCLLSLVFNGMKKFRVKYFKLKIAAVTAAIQDLFSFSIFRENSSFKRFNEQHYRSLVQHSTFHVIRIINSSCRTTGQIDNEKTPFIHSCSKFWYDFFFSFGRLSKLTKPLNNTVHCVQTPSLFHWYKMT